MNTAAKVRTEKERHPERFCSDKACLWRVATRDGFKPCPKHAAANRYAVSARTFVSQDKLDRLAAATQAAHPLWTLQDALNVALLNGVEEMLDRYEAMATRRSTAAAAAPVST